MIDGEYYFKRLIKAIVVFALASFAARVGASMRRASRRDPVTGHRILKYARPVKAAAWLVLGFLVLILISINTSPIGFEQFVFLNCLVLLFVIMTMLYVLEFSFVVVVLTDESIVGFSPWRPPRTIRWDEIESIVYNPENRWFVVRGSGRRKLRLSIYLAGLRDFVQEVRNRVPEPRYRAAERRFHWLGY